MDKELLKKYLTMFRVSVAILGATLVLAILLLMVLVPKMIGSFQNMNKFSTNKTTIVQKKAELKRLKDEIAQAEADKLPDNETKVFYKDIKTAGASSEDILAGEVQEINDLIKYYNIKVYKLSNVYDDENDSFYKGQKDKYSVCRMDMELFSDYMKFQGFLNDLYKHKHFLDIQSVEIKPYKKDKSILHIVMSVSIYAEKSDGTDAAGKKNDVGDVSLDF